MQQLGGFVQEHISRSHCHRVLVVLVIQDHQQPILLHVLVHIDDSAHNMSVDCVHVHTENRSVGVLSEQRVCQVNSLQAQIRIRMIT